MTGTAARREAVRDKRIPVVWLSVLFVALLAACTEMPALLRRHTYPPDFKYIDRTQLRSAMWQLADDVSALDRVMRQPGAIDAARRADVERLLTAMLAATSALHAQGRPDESPADERPRRRLPAGCDSGAGGRPGGAAELLPRGHGLGHLPGMSQSGVTRL